MPAIALKFLKDDESPCVFLAVATEWSAVFRLIRFKFLEELL
jgi:hypothetical protein